MSQQTASRGRPAIISDDELLDVARTVFLEGGLDATTADVAERARVSTSLIFYRYKTKEALFSAVLEREMALPPFFETLPQRVGKGLVVETLFDVGMTVFGAMQTALPLSMLACSSPRLSATMQERIKRNPARERMMKLLSGYFEQEIALGRLSGDEPSVIANAFIGGVFDYVMTQYLAHGTARVQKAPDFLRKLIALLLVGCGPKRPSRSPRSRG